MNSDNSIADLQEKMSQAATRVPLPSRFSHNRRGNQVTIRDSRTNREVTVGLCDYQGREKP